MVKGNEPSLKVKFSKFHIQGEENCGDTLNKDTSYIKIH